MNRIIFANLARLKKNKAFWIALVLIVAIGVSQCQSFYRTQLHYANVPEIGIDFSLDEIAFFPVLIIGIILAVVISLFVGTDYSDGTIRNKIIIGRSRGSIYGANFVTCVIIGLVVYFIGIGTNVVLGVLLLGGFHMKLSTVCMLFVDGLLVTVAYAAIFNLIAMHSPNKVYGAVISILFAFVVLFIAVQVYNDLRQPEMIEQMSTINGEFITETVKNPSYIGGSLRKIYRFVNEVLPSGQAAQIYNLDVPHPYRMAGISVLMIVITNLVGSLLFKKKNLV